MATAAPPASLSWATFALTEARWLKHAVAWSVALWAAFVWVPWLFRGVGVVVELGLLAALVTGLAGRNPAALPPATLLRYALVDATFVASAVPFLIVPLHAALAANNLLPLIGGRAYLVMPTAIFVLAFYAGLGAIGHARAREGLRKLPYAAAGLLLVLLVVQGYGPAVEFARQAGERRAGVAQYERATGRTAGALDQLKIGNSLHGFENRTETIELDARGRILVAGDFSFYGGHGARGFVRLLPDGQLDSSFATLPAGDPLFLKPAGMRVAGDGTILTLHPQDGLSRLRDDGTRDADFRPDVKAPQVDNQPFEYFDLMPDGSIVLRAPARTAYSPEERCLLRLDRSGAHDDAFEIAAMNALFGEAPSKTSPANCALSRLSALPNGQVLVFGAFPATDHRVGFVRLNTDGGLDASFRPRIDLSHVSLYHLTPGGEVFTVSYVPIPGSSPIAYKAQWTKLLASGEVDATFAVPDATFRHVEAMAAQADGKLIVAGALEKIGYGAILRLLPDGRIDPGFGAPPDAPPRVNGFVNTLRVQPDGAIVVGGEFFGASQGAKKVERSNIARLLPDGTPDATFDPR
jgi:uncharacterized delta-60 repeat protein